MYVVLFALASLLRILEKASIVFVSISFLSSGVGFSLIRPRKAQRSKPLQKLNILSFQEKINCPDDSLKIYLEETRNCRMVAQSNFTLF